MALQRDQRRQDTQRDGRVYVTEKFRDPVSREVEQVIYLSDPGDNRNQIATRLIAHLEASRNERAPSRVESR